MRGSRNELEAASRELQGHPLSLTLLGHYLAETGEQDIRRRRELGPLQRSERLGSIATQIMARYEAHFRHHPEERVLRVLGLFDRPGGPAETGALRHHPIPELTDRPGSWWRRCLVRVGWPPGSIGDEDWNRAMDRLCRAGLLIRSEPGQPGTLDGHPFVRGYFEEQLRKRFPTAWRKGHSRLYDHLVRTATRLPTTAVEIGPLYAAVYHGCQAGRYREALRDVYEPRIRQGEERFNLHQLGDSGPGLLAMKQFCKGATYEPVDPLGDSDRAYIMAEVGRYQRALGRLVEAADSLERSFALSDRSGDRRQASKRAGNLSQVHMLMGNLAAANVWAVRGVELAERIGDVEEIISNRTARAEVLHQQGCVEEARRDFEAAEAALSNAQPAQPYLCDVECLRLLDFLLDQDAVVEANTRLNRLRKLRELRPELSPPSLLVSALTDLVNGKILLARELDTDPSRVLNIKVFLDRAVEGFRLAGTSHHLPRGLLARAEFNRLCGDFDKADGDLAEARDVAERGGMELHLTDYWLAFARLTRDQSRLETFQQALVEGHKRVYRLGYNRRRRELLDMENPTAPATRPSTDLT